MERLIVVVALFVTHCDGHGHLTLPPSTRQGATLADGADCHSQACFWFSNNVEIPGNITLPNDMRTVQINVTGGPQDVYATSPWRAPGTAPVFGSGCGMAGGGKDVYMNGGSIRGFPQGMDGIKLPPKGTPTQWKRGGEAEVAWAIAANHGGGYSYRLCPADGDINEECFQRHQLDFASDKSFLIYPNKTRVYFPLVSTREGTYPKGSQWARDPVPGCYLCDAYEKCGAPLAPVPGYGKPDACAKQKTSAGCNSTKGPDGAQCFWFDKFKKCFDPNKPKPTDPASIWDKQVNCYASCAGTAVSTLNGCPAGTETFYPELLPHLSGFKGGGAWTWSVGDTVKVPEDLKPGAYILSWRWDCEESTQVWQNCADVQIV